MSNWALNTSVEYIENNDFNNICEEFVDSIFINLLFRTIIGQYFLEHRERWKKSSERSIYYCD